jgi:alpha-beta hydrolase superfamily lysophospholipase
MSETVELRIDVSNAVDFGEPAHVAASVVLPDPALLPAQPVVCFAKPGGGYSRHYFTYELPGPGEGAQADFHVARGWIFVALDNLGSGESSVHGAGALNFTNVTRAALAAEQEVLLRLANGMLLAGYPPVLQPVRLGIGQSTGGSLAIVQQARYDCYDGIGVLGFSAAHSHPATPPGSMPIVTPWFSRDIAPDEPGGIINAAAVAAATGASEEGGAGDAWTALAWGFHYDDVPQDVVEQDLAHYEGIAEGIAEGIVAGVRPPGERDPAPWNSYTTPNEATRFTLTPGAVAPEAAAVAVPVLSAMGERDLVVDPLGEARAFRSAASFDLFVCPRMGHMHNFAGTRRLFWERIHRFGEWCAAAKALGA